MGEPKEIPPPEFAEWLSTLSCNLKCTHCAIGAGTPVADELNTGEAREMIDALRKFGVPRLCVSGGEFTTREDWTTILEHALENFEQVLVLTNGSLGTELIRKINALPNLDRLILLLSLDGTVKTHDARRGKGSFALAMEVLRAHGPFQKEVVTTVTKENIDGLDELYALVASHEAACWTVQPALPAGRLEHERSLGPQGTDLIAGRIEQFRRQAGSNMRIATSHPVRRALSARGQGRWTGCPAGIEQILIHADGSVTGCVYEIHRPCGNIRSQTLAEIWNGEKMQALRNDPVRRNCCVVWEDAFGVSKDPKV